jgi:hypothetical protein
VNYKKIDVCKKNHMLFLKEHKDDAECMHYSRSRYVKVINEDGAQGLCRMNTTSYNSNT